MEIGTHRIIELLQDAPDHGMQVADLTLSLGLPRGFRSQVRRALKDLCRAGLVVQQGRRFKLAPTEWSEQKLVGRLHVTPRGHGFVDLADAAYDGVFVSRGDLGGAIDGDRVVVSCWGDGTIQAKRDVGRGRQNHHENRRRGRIVEVLERGRTRVVGQLVGPPWQILVDDPRLPMEIEVDDGPFALGKHRGEVMLAEILRYPETAEQPMAVQVVAALGDPGQLTTEVQKVLWENGVIEDFPDDVAAEAERVAKAAENGEQAEVEPGRQDLRDLGFVTIDPEDARDYDDAVYVERLSEPGYHRVWVAIADVSHYVAEGSALDTEARMRSCSVYLPGRAVPMLPEPLSSNICSLLPEVDRMAMVVQFDVGPRGELENKGATTAIIRSKQRLDYPGVAAALAGDLRGKRARYQPFLPQLELLADVASVLRTRRRKRGSLLELDLPEAKVVLDEDDPERVRDMVVNRDLDGIRKAYNIIEELMIAANEAIAEIFIEAEQATIYRIHRKPKEDALERLGLQLGAYGVAAEMERLFAPRGMAKLLSRLEDHPARRALCYLALRAMKQAEYRPENRGHYGLASDAYLHFTSPIRRYPDLHVHRLLKRLLAGMPQYLANRELAADEPSEPLRASPFAVEARSVDELRLIAMECSENERKAMDVERQVVSLYGAALMRDRLGDEFWGTVTGMTTHSVFVSLDEPFVEGAVRLESLSAPAEFDPAHMRVRARNGAALFSLGDRFRVKVVNASLAKRQIEFELAEPIVTHRNHAGVALTKHRKEKWRRFAARGRSKKLGRRRR
jgi:ribonuclease R